MKVRLDAPLPSDPKADRKALDAACRALWGGTEWVRRSNRKGQQMPAAWRFQVEQARTSR